jgi:hypothetical protein
LSHHVLFLPRLANIYLLELKKSPCFFAAVVFSFIKEKKGRDKEEVEAAIVALLADGGGVGCVTFSGTDPDQRIRISD